MKTGPKVVIIVAAVVVAAVGAFIVLRPLLTRRDGIRYVTRPVGFADIAATVNETGTVNPVNTVTVGSEVSGTIRTLGADFNTHVTKGQILATLDPTTYQAAVDSSRANLRLAEANLNSARVNVGKMKALLDMANLTVQRDEPLLKQGLINQNQMDTDNTAGVSANQDWLAAQAQVQVADAQVAVAKAQVAQAEYSLSKTVIKSPWDGIVMGRNVSIGQTVAASLQTPTLFSLATNLTDMQVDTSVDEADAGGVHKGASANFTVTAFPNEIFPGTVAQVRISPIVTQNVVTYDAVVAVHDTSGKLLPGMTAQVTISVGQRTHVMAVPVAALLYRPLAAAGAAGGGIVGAFGGGAGLVQSSGGAPAGQQVAGAPGSQVTVWVLQNGRPAPRQVIIGLSDGKNVEITGGDLRAGDPLVVAQRRGNGGGSAGGQNAAGQNAAGSNAAGQNTAAPNATGPNGGAASVAPADSTSGTPSAGASGNASGGKGQGGNAPRRIRTGAGAPVQAP
jgi:HlyD family secretion protein